MSLIISETKTEWDSAKTNQFCLLAMVGLGIGEIVGAQSFGYVQDRYSNKQSVWFCLVLTVCSCLVSIGYTFHFKYSLWFSAIFCAFWGVQDGASQCLINCICGF